MIYVYVFFSFADGDKKEEEFKTGSWCPTDNSGIDRVLCCNFGRIVKICGLNEVAVVEGWKTLANSEEITHVTDE